MSFGFGGGFGGGYGGFGGNFGQQQQQQQGKGRGNNPMGGMNPAMMGGVNPAMMGGMNPAMMGGGMNPAMMGGGMNPAMMGGGMNPAMMGGGMNPAMMGGGMNPAMMGGHHGHHGGMNPAMMGHGMGGHAEMGIGHHGGHHGGMGHQGGRSSQRMHGMGGVGGMPSIGGVGSATQMLGGMSMGGIPGMSMNPLAHIIGGAVAPLVQPVASAIIKILEDLSTQEKDDTWHSYLEKIPAWAGKPLAPGEFHVGIAFTKPDEEFGKKVAEDLQKGGLKCTADSAHMSNTRAFVLIYSEDAASDETVLRLLTRAAERYNDGSTTIFPLVHPKCGTAVLNQIPNTLAYSLSNTAFVSMVPSPSLVNDPKFVRYYYEKKLKVLNTRVANYVNHTTKWDISGVWLLRVVLKDGGSSAYEVQEFTVFLQQKNEKSFVGTTVNGLQIEGTLDGNSIQLDLKYEEGKWEQIDEQWEADKFTFFAKINGGLKVQGTKFEGSYVDYFNGAKRSGTVSAILEDECLSGYYRFEDTDKSSQYSWGASQEADDKKIAIIQRGDRILGDISGMHGTLFSGVVKDKIFWSYSVGNVAGSFNAKVDEEYPDFVRDENKSTVITGTGYTKNNDKFATVSFKATQMKADELVESHQNTGGMFGTFGMFGGGGGGSGGMGDIFSSMFGAMGQRQMGQMGLGGSIGNINSMHNMMMQMTIGANPFTFEQFEQQAQLEDSYGKKFNIDTTPYIPLSPDEYGVFIGSAEDCKAQAQQLKQNLEKQGIPRVTLDIAHYPKARTFIILLSGGTKSDPKLIEATHKTASSNKPIFNIGLADFFEIFDDKKWNDKEALRNLRDALARLNQTDGTTLDPTNANFNALVRRIKGHVDPPNYNVVGLWFVQCPEAPAQDFMLFVQQNGSNLEAFEFSGAQWKGAIKNDEFVLRKLDAKGDNYVGTLFTKLKEKGKNFIGRYKTHDGKSYNALGTQETDGISGLWEVEKQNFKLGIVQKGGGRLVIQHGSTLYHGVMNGNYALENKGERATYEGTVRNSKTGHVMSGFYYTEKLVSQPFVAKHDGIEKPEEGVIYDVMISYRSTDGKFINLLQAALEEAGISCWRDRRMEVGTNWSEDITRAVRSSRGVICCISDHYIKSSLCTKEILMAHDMGKVIIPLVLPDTEAKEQEWSKLVRASYPSAHPPHMVAREIAKTAWVDFRPLNKGSDPSNAAQFLERYPIVNHLKRQLNNVKQKGCLWDLDGTWQLTFVQDPEHNTISIGTFEANLLLDHTKFSLTGQGAIKGEGFKEVPVVVHNARLDNSVLSFSLKFPKDPAKGDVPKNLKEGVIIVKVMIGIDGESFGGKFGAVQAGNWCNKAGAVSGKLVAGKK